LRTIEETDVETAIKLLHAKKDPLKDEVSALALVKGKIVRGYTIMRHTIMRNMWKKDTEPNNLEYTILNLQKHGNFGRPVFSKNIFKSYLFLWQYKLDEEI